jgi:hypothetical protein
MFKLIYLLYTHIAFFLTLIVIQYCVQLRLITKILKVSGGAM